MRRIEKLNAKERAEKEEQLKKLLLRRKETERLRKNLNLRRDEVGTSIMTTVLRLQQERIDEIKHVLNVKDRRKS